MQQHKQIIPDGAAQEHAQDPLHAHQGRRGKYGRFLLMILVSTVLMHLMTYANNYEVGHIYFSVTRLYMSLMMGALMAVVMLLFMWKMYPDKGVNALILMAGAAVFVVAFFLMRSQTFVGDAAWMRAMIPHHSIAILTSENASLTDPEVKQLAMRIIEARSTRGDEIINENVTPSGSPAAVNTIKSGIDEQEQNGVSVPRSAPKTFAPKPE